MKLYQGVLTATCALALISGAAEAAPKKAASKGRNATTLLVINERTVEVSALTVADQTGKPVGKLATALPAGKRATIKLAKGAGCVLNVTTLFEDEAELEGTTDACKDKVLHLKD